MQGACTRNVARDRLRGGLRACSFSCKSERAARPYLGDDYDGTRAWAEGVDVEKENRVQKRVGEGEHRDGGVEQKAKVKEFRFVVAVDESAPRVVARWELCDGVALLQCEAGRLDHLHRARAAAAETAARRCELGRFAHALFALVEVEVGQEDRALVLVVRRRAAPPPRAQSVSPPRVRRDVCEAVERVAQKRDEHGGPAEDKDVDVVAEALNGRRRGNVPG